MNHAEIRRLLPHEVEPYIETLREQIRALDQKKLLDRDAGRRFFNSLGVNRTYVKALAKKMCEIFYADRPEIHADWVYWEWRRNEVLDNVSKSSKAYKIFAPSWNCNKRPPTERLIENMIVGDVDTLGAYYLRWEDGRGTCVGLDIDNHDGKQDVEGQVYRVQHLLLQVDPHCFILSRSKGGKGYHVRIFFDTPITGTALRNFASHLIKAANLPLKTEIFPKQERLQSRDEYGSQMGIPGSARWMAKGGAWILDPITREPLPLDRWLDALEAIHPFPEKTLRSLAERNKIDLDKPDRPERSNFTTPIKVEGLPPLKTADDVIAFIESHGGVVAKPKGASGKWTHRFILERCFNSDQHGSQDRDDGAAVLFNEEIGRIGYRCCHMACDDSRFSWPKLLKKLGYRVRREPRDDKAPPWLENEDPDPDHQPAFNEPPLQDGAPDSQEPPAGCYHDEPKRRKRRAVRDDRRDFFGGFANAHADDPKTQRGSRMVYVGAARLANKLRDVLVCGTTYKRCKCPCHGHRQTGYTPCSEEYLCPECSHHGATIRKEKVEDQWPERVYCMVVETERGDRDAIRTKRKEFFSRCRAQSKRNPDEPMYVEGAGRQIFFYPEAMAAQATIFPEMRLIPREEAAQLVYEIWQEPYLWWEDWLDQGHTLTQALTEFSWFAKPWLHRVGGGKRARALLPWTDAEKWRSEQHAKWKEEHPGLEPWQCDYVKEQKDGKNVYCALPYEVTCHDTVSGKCFLSYRGAEAGDDDVREAWAEDDDIQKHYKKRRSERYSFSVP